MAIEVDEFLKKLEIKFECEEYERMTQEGREQIGTGKFHFRPKLTFKNGNIQYGTYWTTVTDLANTEIAYTNYYLDKALNAFLDNYNLKQFILNLI